jgi:uncharacterized protein (UPF0333 family)
MGILRKKGQAALEFLTTYGWAFMVILVMIGALAYFGVLNPSKLVPDQCIASSGFTCVDAAANSSGLAAILTANRGETITISGLSVKVGGADITTSSTCSLTNSTGDDVTTFDAGDSSKFGVACTGLSPAQAKKGAKLKADITFNYKLTDGLDHTGSASLTTTVQ